MRRSIYLLSILTVLFAAGLANAQVQMIEGPSSITLERTTFKPGEQIMARFTAPGSVAMKGWIGLVPADVPHGSAFTNDKNDLEHQYLSGQANGTLYFTAPKYGGNYDLRMHNSEKGNEVASVGFFVDGPPRPDRVEKQVIMKTDTVYVPQQQKQSQQPQMQQQPSPQKQQQKPPKRKPGVVRTHGIKFELYWAGIDRSTVTCSLRVTAEKRDLDLQLKGKSVIYDQNGNEYTHTYSKLGNKKTDRDWRNLEIHLIQGIPVSGAIVYENVNPAAARLPMFKYMVWDSVSKDEYPIEYRDVPLAKR
ncbi:hypothetical protein GF324_00395 [bacterium]|nr:hypothetical protein [bacterium]